jgi:hypothetical protein
MRERDQGRPAYGGMRGAAPWLVFSAWQAKAGILSPVLRAKRTKGSYVPGLSSSPLGLTGRSSIPEALMIEPRGRVLDAPAFAEHDSGERRDFSFSRHEYVRVIRPNRPRNRRGRREGRVPTAPMVRVQQKARGRTTGTGGSSGLPCAMVLRLIRDLPGDHAWLPPSSADRSANLAPASERQDHTISPSAAMPLVASTSPASIASRPAFVTTRTPLR